MEVKEMRSIVVTLFILQKTSVYEFFVKLMEVKEMRSIVVTLFILQKTSVYEFFVKLMEVKEMRSIVVTLFILQKTSVYEFFVKLILESWSWEIYQENTMTDLTTEAELYAPIVDEQGRYIDRVPASIRHGLRCPCCPRKDHVYKNYTTFVAHIKTKMHQKWLTDLNNSRANYYVENMQLTDLVKSQRIMIAKLENELKNRNLTIDYLTSQITKMEATTKTTSTVDLLDINI
jgi:hypothetical protein